jgi:hypothetical protein
MGSSKTLFWLIKISTDTQTNFSEFIDNLDTRHHKCSPDCFLRKFVLFVPCIVIQSYNVDQQNTPLFNLIFLSIFYTYIFRTREPSVPYP